MKFPLASVSLFSAPPRESCLSATLNSPLSSFGSSVSRKVARGRIQPPDGLSQTPYQHHLAE
ncbi:MAG TPA: hypothetical protein VNJ52_06150 [Patescibacteria group bacterium]|nr:hypothetical protein [Patescibacteria group bacterium]